MWTSVMLATQPYMVVGLVVIAVAMLTLTLVVTTTKKSNKYTFIICVALLCVFSGLVRLFKISRSISEQEIESRTVSIFGTVLEVREERVVEWAIGTNKCILLFKLSELPYTFETKCASLRIGDKVRVKFIRPKNVQGKPEVLYVYNNPT